MDTDFTQLLYKGDWKGGALLKRRWMVLSEMMDPAAEPGSLLSYYASKEEADAGRPAIGAVTTCGRAHLACALAPAAL